MTTRNSTVTSSVLTATLDRIPLVLRMAVYYTVFLGMILAVLPRVAMQVDSLIPQWSFELPRALCVFGWVVFAGFFVCYTACSWHLTTRGRGAYVEFDPPKQFVASGPFRWCRNPIAACVLGMILGEALALSSIGILLMFVAGLLIAHGQVVLLEEPLLRGRFGQPYQEYLQRVPRWLPRRPRAAQP